MVRTFKRKTKTAVSLVWVIRRHYKTKCKKANFFIFSFNEVKRLKLSSFLKHVEEVKHTVQYLWSAPPYSRRYSQFSSEIFDLSRQCQMEGSRSWSRHSAAPFHHAVLCWKLPFHPLPDSGWHEVTHWLQRNIEVLQTICHGSTETSVYRLHLPTNLFMEASFVVDVMEDVCC